MRLLVLAAVLLSGCASIPTVGTVDLVDAPETPPGRTLLVVPLPSLFGQVAAPSTFTMQGGTLQRVQGMVPDTLRIREFVPLDSTGAASYTVVPVDVLVGALQRTGSWADVRVGALPAGVTLAEEMYRVRMSQGLNTQPMTVRAALSAPPAGSVDAFGPGVDYVLLVRNAGMGFLPKERLQPMLSAGPGPGMMIPGAAGDDVVVIRADLVLWNDATGTVVSFGQASGEAPIRSRVFSSAEARSPRGLLRESRERFLTAAAEALPPLGLDD
ncbi:MAG TPA: hypothetical protein VF594_02915 [Rubricoccaceae bacterium]